MSLKKIEPSKLSSDFGELQTPNHCQKSKISQQNPSSKTASVSTSTSNRRFNGSEVLVPHGEGSLMVFLSDYSGWAWAVLQKNGGKNSMQFQYHPFVEFFLPKLWSNTPNIPENPPTENESHANKGMWTTTQAYIVACYTILLHKYITISWHTSYYHHIDMKLYDITENRTSHVNYNIYDIYEKTPCTSHKILLTSSYKNTPKILKCWCPNLQIDLLQESWNVLFFTFLSFPLATRGRILVTDILGTSPWNLAGLGDWAKSFCVVAVHPGQKMAASQHLSTSSSGYKWSNGIFHMNQLHPKIINSKVKYEQFEWLKQPSLQLQMWEPPRGRWAGCCDLPAWRLHGTNFWSVVSERIQRKRSHDEIKKG